MRIEVYGPAGDAVERPLMGYIEMERPVTRVVTLPADDYEEDDDPFGLAGTGIASIPVAGRMPGSRRMVALAVRTLSRQVEEDDIMRRRAAEAFFSEIPEYAEEERIMGPSGIHRRFSWPALVVPGAEVAETVFEMERFEPAGKACRASHADAMWWATYEAGHRMPAFASGGVIAAGSITAADITANTISPRHLVANGQAHLDNKPSVTVTVNPREPSQGERYRDELSRYVQRTMQKALGLSPRYITGGIVGDA